jgi:AAA15 family ATPase/GTPase
MKTTDRSGYPEATRFRQSPHPVKRSQARESRNGIVWTATLPFCGKNCGKAARFAFICRAWDTFPMLIEFKVANFRSIREEQTLSLVASNADKELRECIIDRDLPGLAGTKFLRGAAIYGPNASGKSNLVKAVQFLADFVARSATGIEPGTPIPVEPFQLDAHSPSLPSVFEITFVAEGVRYVFGCSLLPERVVEEYLVAYPKGAPQRWYQRTYRGGKAGRYEWSPSSANFKSDKSLEEKTRADSLFLSVAAQFNHPKLGQVASWFRKNLGSLRLSVDGGLLPEFTAEYIADPGHRKQVLSILRSADSAVVDAKVRKREMSKNVQFDPGMPPSIVAAIDRGEIRLQPTYDIRLTRLSAEGKPVDLRFASESAGTRRLFALAGPWIDTLENGYTVFIDEIESSLHPSLVRALLKLLLCSETNPNDAQVVFTTHNTTLLDTTLLRRDQIWFTEKGPAGNTHLYPLSDFSPRKGEALAKGYLAGRYGAIPVLRDGLKS